ncbi:MAG TPA: coenzyme F390 synthetase [Methanothermobacter sp.]|nr:coenzyme F390 synthetase [Methanothermobacter sp. MT-2]HHW05246.1 coenzyme F390 synthetase [Methanothermobacter sp.]HOK73409.1 coenzyme F390 synthetase [Methanothermobacter sp.]HOL69689.1 coenzyme F390 synthetase [Methanothermobacter sp.]HPQ05289.1 coenzyme F390 synthetase [Methanothermobacter sp.]
MVSYFNPEIETMDREDIDALVEERIRYTIKYAYENVPFYTKWFQKNKIKPSDIRSHEDLRELPIINGGTVRENQPPETESFEFKATSWEDIFTIHETSGTSGRPKSFFLTWDDWQRYAEKYARAFVSQGFDSRDRVVICASYGMNIGANTMTLAAHKIGMTIIPEGKCTFPVRIIENYKPTSIVASIFKLLRLARRMEDHGLNPKESSIERLVVGGESFAPEAREYLEEIWDVDIFNTYGSTEGTMCGECVEKAGLHVPEDLVHLDVYDPHLEDFVDDGECGRIVLTTLLPVGKKTGILLLNYDTEDTTVVLSRDECKCGRTHMRIMSPEREAETVWVSGHPFNRVDVEAAVFQRENMEYLTGEYEAFLYGDEDEGSVTMQVSLECKELKKCDKELIKENFLRKFFKEKKELYHTYLDGTFEILFKFKSPGALEFYKIKGRPKRIVDRR